MEQFLYNELLANYDIRRLQQNEKINAFDCGDADLNDFIINEAYQSDFGARPIKRYVTRNIETLLANQIIEDKIEYGSKIIIDIKNCEFFVK